MNRPLAIVCLSVLLFLFFISIATEQVRISEFSVEKLIISSIATFLFAIGGLVYCGFAALHAIQRISDPRDRAAWLIMIIFLTVFGSTIYLLTKYQNFRMIGKGSLIRDRRKMRFSEYFKLSEEEKSNV